MTASASRGYPCSSTVNPAGAYVRPRSAVFMMQSFSSPLIFPCYPRPPPLLPQHHAQCVVPSVQRPTSVTSPVCSSLDLWPPSVDSVGAFSPSSPECRGTKLGSPGDGDGDGVQSCLRLLVCSQPASIRVLENTYPSTQVPTWEVRTWADPDCPGTLTSGGGTLSDLVLGTTEVASTPSCVRGSSEYVRTARGPGQGTRRELQAWKVLCSDPWMAQDNYSLPSCTFPPYILPHLPHPILSRLWSTTSLLPIQTNNTSSTYKSTYPVTISSRVNGHNKRQTPKNNNNSLQQFKQLQPFLISNTIIIIIIITELYRQQHGKLRRDEPRPGSRQQVRRALVDTGEPKARVPGRQIHRAGCPGALG